MGKGEEIHVGFMEQVKGNAEKTIVIFSGKVRDAMRLRNVQSQRVRKFLSRGEEGSWYWYSFLHTENLSRVVLWLR